MTRDSASVPNAMQRSAIMIFIGFICNDKGTEATNEGVRGSLYFVNKTFKCIRCLIQ